jgi:hypothetical protein
MRIILAFHSGGSLFKRKRINMAKTNHLLKQRQPRAARPEHGAKVVA